MFLYAYFGGYRIRLCLVIYKTLNSSMFLLLFFEPFSIAFETMQVIFGANVFFFVDEASCLLLLYFMNQYK